MPATTLNPAKGLEGCVTKKDCILGNGYHDNKNIKGTCRSQSLFARFCMKTGGPVSIPRAYEQMRHADGSSAPKALKISTLSPSSLSPGDAVAASSAPTSLLRFGTISRNSKLLLGADDVGSSRPSAPTPPPPPPLLSRRAAILASARRRASASETPLNRRPKGSEMSTGNDPPNSVLTDIAARLDGWMVGLDVSSVR